jgi:enamine deaminase RidA (YjgF/YER057c/UK114 family)
MERLLGGLPAATLWGPCAFTTPVSAADPATGRIDAAIGALGPEERDLLEPEYFDQREERLAIEHVLMWRNVRRILDATDVAFEAIVHQNNWLTVSMQQYAPVTGVRARLFGRGSARTAATSLPVSNLRTPGAAFECSVIGLAAGHGSAGFFKEILLDSHAVGPYYVGAVKAGPYVFAAGEVPVLVGDEGAPRVVSCAAELPGDLRALSLGRVHPEHPVMAQAHCVYRLIEEALQRYRCGLCDVLHQSVYLVEPAHFPALERIATLYYGLQLPPTTLVPIRGASPFRQTLLEIEVTAWAGAVSRDAGS